jgi:hypothetical protein
MSQWELLVTDGHVRAERWRNTVPIVFAVAVIAVIIGIGVTFLLPKGTTSNAVSEAQTAYVATQRAALTAFLEGKGEIERLPANAERSLTRQSARDTIAALLASLNQAGHLPDTVVSQNAEDFWRLDWQAGSVHVVAKGQNILVGYLIDNSYRYPGYRPQPMLRRAFGLFRRGQGNVWSFYCLNVAGAQPCEVQSVEPSAIPATLRDFLPPAAFETEARS